MTRTFEQALEERRRERDGWKAEAIDSFVEWAARNYDVDLSGLNIIPEKWPQRNFRIRIEFDDTSFIKSAETLTALRLTSDDVQKDTHWWALPKDGEKRKEFSNLLDAFLFLVDNGGWANLTAPQKTRRVNDKDA